MENNVEIVEETKNNKAKTIFILKIVGNVVFYLIIIALLLFSIMNINAGSKNGGFPNIFGKGFLSVQTNSMTRDESFNGVNIPDKYNDYEIGEFAAGDLLYVKVAKQKNINKLEVGDVVTFFDSSLKALNTHRVIAISKDGNNVVQVTLQGDLSVSQFGIFDPTDSSLAEHNQNLISRGDVQYIAAADIKGIVTGVNPGAGKVLNNIQQNWLWYFVIPVLIFLLVEVYFVIRNIMELKGAKQKAELASNKEAMLADLEAQKEEMRKQLLAELMAEKEAKAKEENVEVPTTAEAVLDNEEAEASNDQEVTEKTE